MYKVIAEDSNGKRYDLAIEKKIPTAGNSKAWKKKEKAFNAAKPYFSKYPKMFLLDTETGEYELLNEQKKFKKIPFQDPVEALELDIEDIRKAAMLALNRDVIADSLSETIRQEDFEEIDLMHAFEFFELNEKNSLELSERMKKSRLRRRKAKDKLEALNRLDTDPKSSLDFIDGRDNRTYKPRVIKDLF